MDRCTVSGLTLGDVLHETSAHVSKAPDCLNLEISSFSLLVNYELWQQKQLYFNNYMIGCKI